MFCIFHEPCQVLFQMKWNEADKTPFSWKLPDFDQRTHTSQWFPHGRARAGGLFWWGGQDPHPKLPTSTPSLQSSKATAHVKDDSSL